MTRSSRRPNRSGQGIPNSRGRKPAGKRGGHDRPGGRRRKTARAQARPATGPDGRAAEGEATKYLLTCGDPIPPGPMARRAPTPKRDRPDAGSTGQRGAASERCRGTTNLRRGARPGLCEGRARGLERAARDDSAGIAREPTGPATPAGRWDRSRRKSRRSTRATRRSARRREGRRRHPPQGRSKGRRRQPGAQAPPRRSRRGRPSR